MSHPPIKDTFLVGRALLNFTSIFVSLGVFLFGFEQGLMSSLLTNNYFKDYYNDPSPAAVGTMIAILEIGALGSSFIAGKVGDNIGRRRTIRYGLGIFVIGGLLQSFSINIVNLGFGRFISGIAIGFLTTIIPCYQSEISPPDDRGFYACLEFTGNIVGYLTSIWVDYGFLFIENDYSWRIPLFIQVLMGFLLWLGTFVIVETPRWLLDHDEDHEGMIVISDLYADGDVESELAKIEYRSIKENVLISRIEGGERSYTYMFQRYKKRLSIACFSQMFAQLNGINIISYYAPMIFELAGWVGRQAILMTGINSLVYIASTIPPWYLVDSWGRKPLLLSGAVFMGVPLLIIAYSMFLNNAYTANVVVICVIVFNASFGASWGPIPWMMNEVIPNNVRSKGAAALTATNWLFNFIVGEMTPILLDQIKWKTYLIPAASCALSFICVHYLFPETKGLTLEDMGSVFDDSSSIFLYHSSSNLNTSGYGALDDSGAAPPRRTSVSAAVGAAALDQGGVNDVFRQSPASVARNTALSRPEFANDSILTGVSVSQQPSNVNTPLVQPVKSTKSDLDSLLDILGPSNSNVPPREIEPPSYDSIIEFKLAQQRKPGVFRQLFSKIWPGAVKSDEEQQ